MKKFYSIIALLTAFTVGTWADVTPIVSGTKIITIGDAVTDLSTLSDDAYYVLQSQGTSTYYYETNDNKIANGTSNSSAITTDYLVKITKSSNTTGNYYTIQAASGNYYQALNTTSTQLTTGEESSDYLIISQSSNWFFRQVINGQNYNINNYGHQPYGATGTGAFSQIKIYSATLSDAVTITWTINYGDNKRTTYTQKAEPNSTVSCDASYPFTTITGSVNVGTEDCTDNATATFNTPFVSSTEGNETWYWLYNPANELYAYYDANATDYNVKLTTTKPSAADSAYKWAFFGNPIDGYTIKNSGSGKYATAQNGTATNAGHAILGETAVTWTLTTGKSEFSDSFGFGLNGVYINSYGGKNGYFGFYTSSAASDNGSNWQAIAIPATADYTTLESTLATAELYTIGTGLNQYTDANNTLPTAKQTAENVLKNKETNTDASYQTSIDSALNTLNTAIAGLTLNMPTSGTFVRLQSKVSNGYLTSPAIGSSNSVTAETSDVPESQTIWYYHSGKGDENYLLSYYSGEYLSTGQGNSNIKNSNTNISINKPQTSANGLQINNNIGVGVYGLYQMKNGWWYLQSETAGTAVTSNKDANANTFEKSQWYMEQVTSLPVTMHQSGSNYYATVCVPVATTVNGATAYYVSGLSDDYQTEGGYATLTEFTDGIIPANTAAILIGGSSEVSLEVSNEAGTEVTSSLAGSFTATRPSEDNYYFGQKGGTAGFYAVTNIPDGKYISNTAWLAGNSASSSKGFTFVFGDDDPTGINNATAGDAIKTNGVRYNVQGQRVGEGYKGIVIINGKKYLIK